VPGTLNILRLGTRKSALAQAQANWVAGSLRTTFPDVRIEIIFITTTGDRVTPQGSNGKGEGGLKALFTKEIEEALLENRIDLAVHSLKDMSAELPKGLVIGAIPEREDPRDVWISKNNIPFGQIPKNARIGTGAVRRQAQLRRLLPEADLVAIRGNVDTRLENLNEEKLDGIILGLAGLRRLGKEKSATEFLPEDLLVPAIGQGCLGIEIRDRDQTLTPFIKALDHPLSHAAALAERAFLKGLGGSCQTPIAGHASIKSGELILKGLAISPNGQEMVSAQENGRPFDAAGIGARLAQKLLAAGADKILSL